MRISDWSFRRVLFRSRHKVGLLQLCFAQPAAKRHSSVATRKSENCALQFDTSGLSPIAIHRPRIGRERPGRQCVRQLVRAGFVLAKESIQPQQPVMRQCKSDRSEEHTSELQSLMRISYAVYCLKKKKRTN